MIYKKKFLEASFSFSVTEDITSEQVGYLENMRDFSGEENPLGYRLRSLLLPSKSHARSAFLTVFLITQPDLLMFSELEILPFSI